MTIRLKLFSGFSILILIFIVGFFVNRQFSKEVIRNTDYINNSEIVIRNSNLLHKIMIDMQSGYRGYLLSGQESFLKPYYDGLRHVPSLVKSQYALLSSPGQTRRLDSIRMLHNQWVQYANMLISARQDPSPAAAKRYEELFEKKLRREVGKKLNDEIRQKFQAFDNYEYGVRRQRRVNLQRSIANTQRISLALMVFSIGLALATSFYIIRIITGRISKMVHLAEDISQGNFRLIDDRRNDELRQLSESLNTMSRKLNKNFKELTKKNKELDQFAYVVSHDLKAPLRGIDNVISWMEEDHGGTIVVEVQENLELIKGRTRRLENMINGLLDYARVGKTRKGSETVDVGLLVHELCELLVPEGFIVAMETQMPLLNTNRLQIEQVFSNLISNAVKYNDKRPGKISIRAADEGSFYRFVVADNGIGIQEEYFEKIFTIFQTLQERDAFESTGVGLAIVKKIVEEQKGTVALRSTPGKGTEFAFTWPKQREPDE